MNGPNPFRLGDYISMRNAYMKVHGRLEDKVIPSKEDLKKKLQELENGEFRAETPLAFARSIHATFACSMFA